MNKVKLFLIFIGFLIFSSPSNIIFGLTSETRYGFQESYSPTNVGKNIDVINEETISELSLSVKLIEEQSVITGNFFINYYNNDAISFERLPFHLYPSGMQYENRSGKIEIIDISTVSSPITNLSYEVLSNKQLMWVNLNTPLEPSQNLSLNIRFNTTLPDGLDRANFHGYNDNNSRIYTCTAFYPIPCVYDEYDGWNTDPYLKMGDPFYFDMANYELIIEVPSEMIVAAVGDLLDIDYTDERTTKYHYKANHPVREVVFTASRYFIVDSKIINSVNVSTYYLPHSSELWRDNALDYAVNSLLLFNEFFGVYPYSTYDVVEAYGFYRGMEYPCLVQISEAINIDNYEDPSFWLELVIAHETAHQWWCHLVGNDQIDWGHLDEGIASWATEYYVDYYKAGGHYFDSPGYWLLNEVRSYSEPSKVNQSIYESIQTNTDYSMTAYRKAPIILQKLRVTIGNENFIAGLRHFFEEYKFKLATFPDLQKSFEIVLGKSFDWFFIPWFDNTYLPNYDFDSVSFDKDHGIMEVIVKDLNEKNNNYSFSQKIPIIVYDIRRIGVLYQGDFWINGTTTIEFELDVHGNPGEVMLVYEPDILAHATTGSNIEWFNNTPHIVYSDDSWYSKPETMLVSFRQGDSIEWNVELSYTDTKNLIDPVEESGVVRCNILVVRPETRTLFVDTDMTWSFSNDVVEQFVGSFSFNIDQEGHATPYYILLFSPFVGRDFRFSETWIDSIALGEAMSINSITSNILDDGKRIEMHVVFEEYNDFTIDVKYNVDGILEYYNIQIDSFYPTDSEGPELRGKLTFNLRQESVTTQSYWLIIRVVVIVAVSIIALVFARGLLKRYKIALKSTKQTLFYRE